MTNSTRKPNKTSTTTRNLKTSVSPNATPGQKIKAPKKSATKTDLIFSLLRKPGGATIDELTEVAGWQPHSVRGFLSGTVKKKLGLSLLTELDPEKVRRYRITDGSAN